MTILRKKEYLLALKGIIIFISKDSKNRAIEFKNKLDEKTDIKIYEGDKYSNLIAIIPIDFSNEITLKDFISSANKELKFYCDIIDEILK